MLIRRTETIKMYTSLSAAYEYARPDRASKFMPDWWRSLPKEADGVSPFPRATMKTCHGFVDMFSESIITPMWCDLAVIVGKRGTDNIAWEFSNEKSHAEVHGSYQWGNYYRQEDYAHLKVVTPWVVQSDSNIKFMMTDPTYNKRSLGDYQVMPGNLEFKHQHSLNTNIFFNRGNEDTRNIINFGDAFHMLTPLTEKRIKIKHYLVSHDEILKRQKSSLDFVSFTNAYTKAKRAGSKCPYRGD